MEFLTHVESYMRSQHHSATVQLWCVFGNMPGMTGSFFFLAMKLSKAQCINIHYFRIEMLYSGAVGNEDLHM